MFLRKLAPPLIFLVSIFGLVYLMVRDPASAPVWIIRFSVGFIAISLTWVFRHAIGGFLSKLFPGIETWKLWE